MAAELVKLAEAADLPVYPSLIIALEEVMHVKSPMHELAFRFVARYWFAASELIMWPAGRPLSIEHMAWCARVYDLMEVRPVSLEIARALREPALLPPMFADTQWDTPPWDHENNLFFCEIALSILREETHRIPWNVVVEPSVVPASVTLAAWEDVWEKLCGVLPRVDDLSARETRRLLLTGGVPSGAGGVPITTSPDGNNQREHATALGARPDAAISEHDYVNLCGVRGVVPHASLETYLVSKYACAMEPPAKRTARAVLDSMCASEEDVDAVDAWLEEEFWLVKAWGAVLMHRDRGVPLAELHTAPLHTFISAINSMSATPSATITTFTPACARFERVQTRAAYDAELRADPSCEPVLRAFITARHPGFVLPASPPPPRAATPALPSPSPGPV